jgi:hypothetical protein
MKKLTVKQNNVIKQEVEFGNDEALNEFIATLNAGNTAWGKASYERELTPKVLDQNTGEVLEEATYETVPAEFTYEVIDVTEEVELRNRLEGLVSKGREFEEACMDCLRIVGAYNEERSLTLEQILEMGTLFANIEQVLNRRMPKTAKALVSQLTPDGVLVTQELKNLLLVNFQKKGF